MRETRIKGESSAQGPEHSISGNDTVKRVSTPVLYNVFSQALFLHLKNVGLLDTSQDCFPRSIRRGLHKLNLMQIGSAYSSNDCRPCIWQR